MAKIEKMLTMLIALWGCILSTYLFIQDYRDSKPSIYSSYALIPEPEQSGKRKTERVRMDISVSNTGKDKFEVPPIISITLFDVVTRKETQIKANLIDENGNSLSHIIPTLLEQGQMRVYRTSYQNLKQFMGPNIATVIQLWSGDNLYIAPSEPSANPDGIKQILNNDLIAEYLTDIKSYPVKFYRVELP